MRFPCGITGAFSYGGRGRGGAATDPQYFGDTNQTFNDRRAAAAMLKSVHKRLIDLDIVYRRVEISLSLHPVQESSFNGFCGASKLNT
ncbi:hypothetical protein V1281_001788 [Nitrobacteraceae bacterium AZCC 2161]